jgi:D-alanine-D-alanine ligase
VRIAVIFDGVSALGKTPDLSILHAVEAIEAALSDHAHEAVRVPVGADARWIERLRRGRFDVVFNLCEGLDGISATEPAVIGVLELLGIPYTGNSSATASLCLRKHLVNTLLDRAGLPVPRWGVVRPGGSIPAVGFPAICKPAAEDGSLGVEQRSVVRTGRALAERVDAMHTRWDEVLVQRFIDGREVAVGIVGDQVLPISEVKFDAMPRGMWRIVSYRSKWDEGSDEDRGSVPQCPADLSSELEAELSGIAVAAWRLVGGVGYGRVDFRIDRSGRPWVLEVNANPDASPDAGLARMGRAAGLEYPELIQLIIERALETRRDGSTVSDEHWMLTQQLSGVPAGW